jgi:hypothetical protein
VTEVERYEKKSSQSKQSTKMTPQQAWTNLIAEAAAAAASTTNNDTTLPRHLRSYLQTMANLDNVPRKAKAFYNFTSNSLNLRGPKGQAIVTEIWNYLDSLRKVASNPSVTVSESSASQSSTVAATSPATSAVVENSALPSPTTMEALATSSAEHGATTTTIKDSSVPSATGAGTNVTPDNTTTRSLDLTTTTGALTKKTVHKAMKHCLKGQATLKLSQLRTLVRQRVGVDAKDSAQRRLVKQLVQTVLGTKKDAFVQEGKTVSLAVRSK